MAGRRVVVVLSVAVAATAVRRRGGVAAAASRAAMSRRSAAGVVAVAVVGRASPSRSRCASSELRHHPIVDRYGTVAAVIVTPSETPRSLGGGRLMFRGSLQRVAGDEMSGRVVVFASTPRFAELTAGQPAAFTARIGRPTRRDLTVAVLVGDG